MFPAFSRAITGSRVEWSGVLPLGHYSELLLQLLFQYCRDPRKNVLEFIQLGFSQWLSPTSFRGEMGRELPMVEACSGSNLSSVNLSSRLLLPVLESPIRRILKVERSSRVATEENGKKEKETQLVLRHRGRRRRQEEEEAGGRRREKVEAPWESLMTFEK